MSGEFYTDHDIQDLLDRGVRTLTLKSSDRITDIARERALKGGMRIIWPDEGREAAPHRYPPIASPGKGKPPSQSSPADADEMRSRVRASVISRLGGDVDAGLLDDIITRVFKQLGMD